MPEGYKTLAEEGVYDWAKTALEGGHKVTTWFDEKVIEPVAEVAGTFRLIGRFRTCNWFN